MIGPLLLLPCESLSSPITLCVPACQPTVPQMRLLKLHKRRSTARLQAIATASGRSRTSTLRRLNYCKPETPLPMLTARRCRQRLHWRWPPVLSVALRNRAEVKAGLVHGYSGLNSLGDLLVQRRNARRKFAESLKPSASAISSFASFVVRRYLIARCIRSSSSKPRKETPCSRS